MNKYAVYCRHPLATSYRGHDWSGTKKYPVIYLGHCENISEENGVFTLNLSLSELFLEKDYFYLIQKFIDKKYKFLIMDTENNLNQYPKSIKIPNHR